MKRIFRKIMAGFFCLLLVQPVSSFAGSEVSFNFGLQRDRVILRFRDSGLDEELYELLFFAETKFREEAVWICIYNNEYTGEELEQAFNGEEGGIENREENQDRPADIPQVESIAVKLFARNDGQWEECAALNKSRHKFSETLCEVMILEEEAAAETEAGTEASSEAETETGAEASSEAGTEDGTEAASEAGTETGSEASSEAGTETEAEAASEAETETGSEASSEAGTETETGIGESGRQSDLQTLYVMLSGDRTILPLRLAEKLYDFKAEVQGPILTVYSQQDPDLEISAVFTERKNDLDGVILEVCGMEIQNRKEEEQQTESFKPVSPKEPALESSDPEEETAEETAGETEEPEFSETTENPETEPETREENGPEAVRETKEEEYETAETDISETNMTDLKAPENKTAKLKATESEAGDLKETEHPEETETQETEHPEETETEEGTEHPGNTKMQEEMEHPGNMKMQEKTEHPEDTETEEKTEHPEETESAGEAEESGGAERKSETEAWERTETEGETESPETSGVPEEGSDSETPGTEESVKPEGVSKITGAVSVFILAASFAATVLIRRLWEKRRTGKGKKKLPEVKYDENEEEATIEPVKKETGLNQKIKIHGAVMNHKGMVRGNNEDNFYFNGIFMRRDEIDQGMALSDVCKAAGQIYAVCDGMGGTDAGEEASYRAVQELFRRKEEYGRMMNREQITCIVREISDQIHEDAKQRGQKSGTTIAMMVLEGAKAVFLNVGDSRIYRFRRRKLQQLSLDHSRVQRMISMGLMTPEQAKKDPSRHVITQYLGMPSDIRVSPYLVEEELLEEDVLVLCSDGLTDMVEDAQIERILKEKDAPEEAVKELLNAALKNGGRDNVTIMVLCVEKA